MATFRYIFNGNGLYGFPICGRGLMLVKNFSSSNAILYEIIGAIKSVAEQQISDKSKSGVIHICDDGDFNLMLACSALFQ